MTDITITFTASQPGDECGMCDCIAAGLLDRDVDQHFDCRCGWFAHRRVTIQHGDHTDRLPVCGACMTSLMSTITQAVTPDSAPVGFEAEFEAIIRGLHIGDDGEVCPF